MVSFEFVVSYFQSIITSFKYRGELSFSILFLVIQLADRKSNFLLQASIGVLYASSLVLEAFLGHFRNKIDLFILLSVWNPST